MRGDEAHVENLANPAVLYPMPVILTPIIDLVTIKARDIEQEITRVADREPMNILVKPPRAR